MTKNLDRFGQAGNGEEYDRDFAGNFDAGLRRYMISVYSLMAGGLTVSGLTAYFAVATGFYQQIISTPLIWLVMFAPLIVVLFLGFLIDRISYAGAQLAFWIYAILMGLSLSSIFLAYTGSSIVRTFFVAAATFGATSLYGYMTERDLSRFGSFLFMALFGVVIASVVGLFVASPALELIISIAGSLLFVALTAYDTQRIKAIYFQAQRGDEIGKRALIGALTLYLDFINLFIMLLRLTGDRRNS